MTPTSIDTTTPFGGRTMPLKARAAWRVATLPWPPRLKRRLRRIARRFVGPYDVTLAGDRQPASPHLAFRIYPAENYCDRIIAGRNALPEADEHAALLPHLAPGMTFIDIGANVGAYSVFVGAHVPGARILAFEPHPRTSAKLRYNLTANGIGAEVVEAALGEADGTMQLWSDGGGNIGQTSLLPEATSNAKVSVDVTIVRLADVLAANGIDHVDLVKIDVEGFEDRALGHFLETAEPSLLPGAILLELEHRHLWQRDLVAMLEGLGYRRTFAREQNALYVRT